MNFGHAFEVVTSGAVRATVHRVVAPKSAPEGGRERYSVPFFMGLPFEVSLLDVREEVPVEVREMRSREKERDGSGGELDGQGGEEGKWKMDPRWERDVLGESMLRKWIRSHPDVARKWYGENVVERYLK